MKAELKELGDMLEKCLIKLSGIKDQLEEGRTKYWGLYDTADNTWSCRDEISWNVRPKHRQRFASEAAAEAELQTGQYARSIVSKPFYVKK